MKPLALLLTLLLLAAPAAAQEAKSAHAEVLMKRDIPYSEPVLPLQKLDVYAPAGAKRLPVVFWIHGGGWQTGDKSEVHIKPQVFNGKGFVLVSTNYRLLPNVD